MKRILLIIIFGFSLSLIYAQDVFHNADTVNFPYSEWTPLEIENSNTAKNVDYLTDAEKDIIHLANLCRINPSLFSKTFLEDYATKNDLLRNSYVKSLRKTLKKQGQATLFKPNKTLWSLAKEHAQWSGKYGKLGHQHYKNRSSKSNYEYFCENCQYGYSNALDIYMDLLIDTDIPDLGHRINFLSKDVDNIGVSIQPHKTYEYNCVVDFGGN